MPHRHIQPVYVKTLQSTTLNQLSYRDCFDIYSLGGKDLRWVKRAGGGGRVFVDYASYICEFLMPRECQILFSPSHESCEGGDLGGEIQAQQGRKV